MSQEDPLEKGMVTHSSILSWRIPWTEEPGGLFSPWDLEELDTIEPLTLHFSGSTYISRSLFFFFLSGFLKKLFIYLFMTMLGIPCCTEAFYSCCEWGLLSSCGAQLLSAVASLVIGCGL